MGKIFNSEERLSALVGADFDGWVVGAADGVPAPFEHENDFGATLTFFKRFLEPEDEHFEATPKHA